MDTLQATPSKNILGKTVRKCCCSIKCLALSTSCLFFGVCHAAKAGSLLPRLTLMLPCQAIAHWFLFVAARIAQPKCHYWRWVSLYILVANTFCCTMGYTILILIYRHSVQTIFNRNIPRLRKDDDGIIMPIAHPALQSFNAHLLIFRPLEVFFRFITAPLRVLPDLIVLGETRCGTTNLCGTIVSLSNISSLAGDRIKIKCYQPFCAWNVPELDHKESFFFVGHYLGIVDPYLYRMAFPLKITRWWEEEVRGNFFFCFDGCAQYLSSPTAPYLISRAYEGNAPPILVACLRNPVDQALSWWRYENNAMVWGESMGLKEWNTALRSKLYPPKTIASAVEFSKSDFVQNSCSDAENLTKTFGQVKSGHISNTARPLFKLIPGNITCTRLPSWAITWPGGQLSTIGRSGNYAVNIDRYNKVFSAAEGKSSAGTTWPNKKGFVHTVLLECQSDGRLLKLAIRPFLSDVVLRSSNRRKLSFTTLMSSMEVAIDRVTQDTFGTRRNSSAALELEFEASEDDLAILGKCFQAEIYEYSSMAKIFNEKYSD